MNCICICKMDNRDYEMCKALAQMGMDIWFTYQKENEVNANKLMEGKGLEGKAVGIRIDFMGREAISSLVEEIEASKIKVDCLLTSFHSCFMTAVNDIDSKNVELMINDNINLLYYSLKKFLPLLMESKGLYCNLVDSCAYHYVPNKVAYGMTQAASIGFVKSLAKEYFKYGIRAVNFVVDTKGHEMIEGNKFDLNAEKNYDFMTEWQQVCKQIAESVSMCDLLTGQSVFLDNLATDYVFC